MGLLKGFRATSVPAKIAFIFLLVTSVFNWLSFTLSDWGLMDNNAMDDDNKMGYGIWKLCGNQEPNPNCQDLVGWRLSWFGAFQAFCVFGFVTINLALLLCVLFIYASQCRGNREMGLFCGLSSFCGAICYLVAIIIFGVKWDSTYDMGYDKQMFGCAFYFAIVVVVLATVAGIFSIIAILKKHQVTSSGEEGRSQSTKAAQNGK